MDYTHFRSEAALTAGRLLWVWYSPLLLLLGTVGNVLSIVVFTRRRFSQKASSVFFIGLSVADLSVLYSGLFYTWLRKVSGTDFNNQHVMLCKLERWLVYSSSHISPWILTTVTLDRLFSTVKPHRRNLICSKKHAAVILASMVTFFLTLNLHFIFGMDRVEVFTKNMSSVTVCWPASDKYGRFVQLSWPWINLCIFCLSPFVVMSLGNICIMCNVFESYRNTRVHVYPELSDRPSHQTQETVAHKKLRSMTKLLCSLNIIFIVCNTPVCVYFIGFSQWIPPDLPLEVIQNDPLAAVSLLTYYTNNAVNFALYCVSGSLFREEVKKIAVKCLQVTVCRTHRSNVVDVVRIT